MFIANRERLVMNNWAVIGADNGWNGVVGAAKECQSNFRKSQSLSDCFKINIFCVKF